MPPAGTLQPPPIACRGKYDDKAQTRTLPAPPLHTRQHSYGGFPRASVPSQSGVQRETALMSNEHQRWMDQAVDEARAALLHDDVPVGAVVIHNGDIIAARHNERELTGDPVAHAEVLALRDAAARLGTWRLDECTLYVTLEPCAMCAGAMVNARLGSVVFGATDPKAGAVVSHFGLLQGTPLNHAVPTTPGVSAEECGELLRTFFRSRR